MTLFIGCTAGQFTVTSPLDTQVAKVKSTFERGYADTMQLAGKLENKTTAEVEAVRGKPNEIQVLPADGQKPERLIWRYARISQTNPSRLEIEFEDDRVARLNVIPDKEQIQNAMR